MPITINPQNTKQDEESILLFILMELEALDRNWTSKTLQERRDAYSAATGKPQKQRRPRRKTKVTAKIKHRSFVNLQLVISGDFKLLSKRRRKYKNYTFGTFGRYNKYIWVMTKDRHRRTPRNIQKLKAAKPNQKRRGIG